MVRARGREVKIARGWAFGAGGNGGDKTGGATSGERCCGMEGKHW